MDLLRSRELIENPDTMVRGLAGGISWMTNCLKFKDDSPSFYWNCHGCRTYGFWLQRYHAVRERLAARLIESIQKGTVTARIVIGRFNTYNERYDKRKYC